MSWSSRRQFAYSGSVMLVLLVLFSIWAYQTFLNKPANCFDGKMNGDETGIDCGGSCALLCKADTHAPVVVWTRALQTGQGRYTAAAYIENPQGISAGAYGVRYDFKLLDANNQLVVETPPAEMNFPPMQTIPVVFPNIDTGSGVVAHAFFQFLGDVNWEKIPRAQIPALRVEDENLSPDGTKLSATIVNDGTSEVRNLAVDAVVFDTDGTAQAASKSVLDRIPPGSSVPVVFTWSVPLKNVARAEILPVPALSQ